MCIGICIQAWSYIPYFMLAYQQIVTFHSAENRGHRHTLQTWILDLRNDGIPMNDPGISIDYHKLPFLNGTPWNWTTAYADSDFAAQLHQRTPVSMVRHATIDSSRVQVSHAFVIFYFLYITIIAAWFVWSKSFVFDVPGATARPVVDFSLLAEICQVELFQLNSGPVWLVALTTPTSNISFATSRVSRHCQVAGCWSVLIDSNHLKPSLDLLMQAQNAKHMHTRAYWLFFWIHPIYASQLYYHVFSGLDCVCFFL